MVKERPEEILAGKGEEVQGMLTEV